MAEIKSTLDIIMEKAKKFSVTEEEKKGFRRQELEGKIKGLVQKALDGVLDYGRFQTEVVALQAKEKDLVDPDSAKRSRGSTRSGSKQRCAFEDIGKRSWLCESCGEGSFN